MNDAQKERLSLLRQACENVVSTILEIEKGNLTKESKEKLSMFFGILVATGELATDKELDDVSVQLSWKQARENFNQTMQFNHFEKDEDESQDE